MDWKIPSVILRLGSFLANRQKPKELAVSSTISSNSVTPSNINKKVSEWDRVKPKELAVSSTISSNSVTPSNINKNTGESAASSTIAPDSAASSNINKNTSESAASSAIVPDSTTSSDINKESSKELVEHLAKDFGFEPLPSGRYTSLDEAIEATKRKQPGNSTQHSLLENLEFLKAYLRENPNLISGDTHKSFSKTLDREKSKVERDAQFNTVPYIEKKGNFVSRLLTSILPHKVHLPEHSVPQENNTLNELAVPDAKERESFVSRLFTTILPHKVHPPEHSGTPTGSYVEKLNGERSNTPKGPHGRS